MKRGDGGGIAYSAGEVECGDIVWLEVGDAVHGRHASGRDTWEVYDVHLADIEQERSECRIKGAICARRGALFVVSGRTVGNVYPV